MREMEGRLHPSKSQTAQETPDSGRAWFCLACQLDNAVCLCYEPADDSSALEHAQINSPGYKIMELAKN